MKTSTALKLVTAIGETLAGIPLIGGLFIISMLWTPLILLFGLHIVALYFSAEENTSIGGSILGIVTNVLGVIPILGMFMHIATAIVLWITFVNEANEE